MHVLKVVDTDPSSTAGVSALTLASGREMRDRGHQVDFWFQPDLLPGLRSPGLRRLIVPWFIAYRVLKLAFDGAAPDIVEVHEPIAAPTAAICRLLKWSALPVCVVFSHGLEILGWRAYSAMERAHGRRVPLKSRILHPLTLLSQAQAALRLAGGVLVVSGADQRYLVDTGRLRTEQVTCCYTAVLLEPRQVSTRRDGGDLRVLYLGSWLPRKGTVELVQVWRELEAVRSEVHLTVAGTGTSQDARTAVGTLRSASLVPTVLRSELDELLSNHDVFILPSWFEGMSLAVLEAAAAGLACIVTQVAGSLDLFPRADADGALTAVVGDTRALLSALVRLADSPRLRHDLGARAEARAKYFTLSRCVDQQLLAYHAALGAVGAVQTRARRPN